MERQKMIKYKCIESKEFVGHHPEDKHMHCRNPKSKRDTERDRENIFKPLLRFEFPNFGENHEYNHLQS
jgi:hypothetical protein